MIPSRLRVPLAIALAVLAVACAGCGGSVAPATNVLSEGFPADFPLAAYEESAGRVYRFSETGSELLITVYRGGPLARFVSSD